MINNSESPVPFNTTENAITLNKELVSYDTFKTVDNVFKTMTFPIIITGIITNSINIRVFLAQGVSNNNTNIGLLSLSIFDLLNSMVSLPYTICYIFGFMNDPVNQTSCIAYATILVYQHYVLNNCSTWTTVYLSLERALCVVIPLKVKLIFRPKLTTALIVFVFVFFFAAQAPYSYSNKVVWKFHPLLNDSVAVVQDSVFSRKYMQAYTTVRSVMSNVAMAVVIVNTAIMVYKLIQIKKWRQGNSTAVVKETSEKDSVSSKDIELIKSVTTVTGVFLVCVVMDLIPSLAILTLPGVSFTGINRNLFLMVYSIRGVFGVLNLSINFFFYIRVSSRYKEAFDNVFRRHQRKE